jgi:streptogramin lyase
MLNKDSLIVILDKQTNNFKIYSHSGYLNIDTFQFTDTDGQILFTDLKSNSGRVDSTGVISMWAFPQRCVLDPSIEKKSISTLRDVEYNNSFDR